MTHASVWFPYPLIICNIFILFIAISIKITIADVSAMTRAERLQYDEALKKYRDTISVFEGVRMEGRMEGREEGQKEEKIANARKMKTYGLALEMISDITGLTIDEVKSL